MSAIHQQLNSQGFHIGSVAASENAPGAVNAPAPVYDKATEKAKWGGEKWIVKTIAEWDAPVPPTPEQVLEQDRLAAKADRDMALQAITHTFPDGAVVQVRPSDLANFQMAISQGTDRKWVLADNTTRMTTVAELQAAMNDGIAQGQVIWDDYIAAIEALGV